MQCRGRDLNPGLSRERAEYLTGLYYPGDEWPEVVSLLRLSSRDDAGKSKRTRGGLKRLPFPADRVAGEWFARPLVFTLALTRITQVWTVWASTLTAFRTIPVDALLIFRAQFAVSKTGLRARTAKAR